MGVIAMKLVRLRKRGQSAWLSLAGALFVSLAGVGNAHAEGDAGRGADVVAFGDVDGDGADGAIIPRAAFEDACKKAKRGEPQPCVTVNGDVRVVRGAQHATIAPVDGMFPAWRDCFPPVADYATAITFDADVLEKALASVPVDSDGKRSFTMLLAAPHKPAIVVNGNGQYMAVVMPCMVEGEKKSSDSALAMRRAFYVRARRAFRLDPVAVVAPEVAEFIDPAGALADAGLVEVAT